MSEKERTGVAPSAAPPEGLQALTDEIERTREELGEKVGALVARADVTARAREKAAVVARRVSGKAKEKASQVKEKASQVKEKTAARIGSGVAAAPEPVRRAARQVASR